MSSYKNLLNNTVIKEEDILSIADDTMTFFDGDMWKTISMDNVEEIVTRSSSSSENDDDSSAEFLRTYYHNPQITLKAGLCIPNTVAYFRSNPISITPGRTITISSEYDEGDYGAVELYIIDGSKSVPIRDTVAILDTVHTEIKHERCWFGRDFRFTPADDTIKFYADMEYDKSITSLSDINFSDGKSYTVSYTPKNLVKSTEYSPENTTIQILIILRSYDNTKKQPIVKNLKVIEKSGV